MSELLRVRDLSKSYHDATRELTVLKGLDLTVRAGEATAIVGMSGAGKSTMLHLLGGLDRDYNGTIEFSGRALSEFTRTELDAYRTHSIGFIFQFHHLLPEFTALENVMMPALVARRPRSEARERARALLAEVGLAEREDHPPSKLSGGEQQRVALARALMNEPKLLLADEPTGNLDLKTGKRVIELIWKATVEKGRSIVIVTHEPTIAERADRIFMLRNGKLDHVKHDDLARQMVQV
jgi:lipoprotein-releasing system ATP-binding protein